MIMKGTVVMSVHIRGVLLNIDSIDEGGWNGSF
jgi:hypothetical protein